MVHGMVESSAAQSHSGKEEKAVCPEAVLFPGDVESRLVGVVDLRPPGRRYVHIRVVLSKRKLGSQEENKIISSAGCEGRD